MKLAMKLFLISMLILTALLMAVIPALANPTLRVEQTAPDTFIYDTAGKTYQAVITNVGNVTATNVRVTIDLPAGFIKLGTPTAVFKTGSGDAGTALPISVDNSDPFTVTFNPSLSLAPNQIVAISYQLATTLDVPPGNTDYITVNETYDYIDEGSGLPVTDYAEHYNQLVNVKEGVIQVTLTPLDNATQLPISAESFQGQRYDTITLEAKLTNSGEGPLYNVQFTTRWGGNFQWVGWVNGSGGGITPTGNSFTYTTGLADPIQPGASVSFQYQLKVIDYQVDFSLSSEAETDPASPGDPASVSLIFNFLIKQPNISITPDPIVIEYGAAPQPASIVIANNGEGPARNFKLNTAIHNIFAVSGVASGWTYANGTFSYDGVINPGDSVTLTFAVTPAHPNSLWADPSTGSILMMPSYNNDIDQIISYPIKYLTYTINNVPTLRLTQSVDSDESDTDGDINRIYLGELIHIDYTPTLTHPEKWTSSEIVLTDTVPGYFTVINVTTGGVGSLEWTPGSNSITWRLTPAQVGSSPQLTIYLKAPSDPDLANSILTNSATVQGATAWSPLSATRTASLYLQSRDDGPVDFSYESKSHTNLPAEGSYDVCGLDGTGVDGKSVVAYQVDYSFGSGSGGRWTGSTMSDQLNRSQIYLNDSNHTPQYRVDGGSWKNVPADRISVASKLLIDLGFLTDDEFGGVDAIKGKKVSFRYWLRLTDASLPSGSGNPTSDEFISVTELLLKGANNGSGPDHNLFYQGVFVPISRAALGISTSFVNYPVGAEGQVAKGQTVQAVINVTNPGNTPWNRNNLVVTLTTPVAGGSPNGSYSYLGPLILDAVKVTGFGGKIPAVVIDSGSPESVKFTFDGPVTAGGTIAFDLVKTDSDNYTVQAKLDFNDDLARSTTATAAYTPPICLEGKLSLIISPDPIQVNANTVAWKINVTNIGNGISYGSVVEDNLNGILGYQSSTPAFSSQNGAVVAWDLGNLNPGESRNISITAITNNNADFSTNTNVVTAKLTWDDRNFVAHDFNIATVAAKPKFIKLTSSSFVENLCDDHVELGSYVTIKLRVKNNGLTTNYNYLLTQDFENTGFVYQTGSAAINGDAVSDPEISGTKLIFAGLSEFQSLEPQEEVILTFRVYAPESFNSYRKITPSATWQIPTDSTIRSGSFTGAQFLVPQFLSNITVMVDGKNLADLSAGYTENVVAVQGEEVEWRIRVQNSGTAAAKNVTLKNVLPSNMSFESIRKSDSTVPVAPIPYKDPTDTTITPSVDTLWVISDVAQGTINTYYIRATFTGNCGAVQQDTARVTWGPETSSLSTPGHNTDTANFISQAIVDSVGVEITDFTTKTGRVTVTLRTSGAPLKDLVLPLNISDRFQVDSAMTYGGGLPTPVSAPASGASGTLIWRWDGGEAVWIEAGTYTIAFDIRDHSTGPYCSDGSAVSSINNYTYKNSGDDTKNGSYSLNVTPAKTLLTVIKTPVVRIAQDGGAVAWTITVKNDGTATATKLEIKDVLGDGFTYGSAMAQTSNPSNPIGAPTVSGGELTWSGLTLNTGETFTITVNAMAKNNGSHITSATATEWNNEQVYSVDQKSKDASVAMVAFGKTLTPATGNSFGEIVKYTIEATIHDQSDYRNIIINDTLPVGLELVTDSESHSIEHSASTPAVTFTPSGKNLSWSIDQLTGDGVGAAKVTLIYQARIWKEGAVAAGSTLTNSAKMGFAIQNADSSTTSFPNTLAGLQSSQSFTVKEPSVSLTQRTSTPVSGETVMAGNTINHVLTVANANGVNVSSGYEMVIEETLPVGEETTAPSNVTITKGSTNLVLNTDYNVNSYDPAIRKLIITFRNTANAVLQPGESFTINFTTTVNAGIAAGMTLNHSAALTAYSSQPVGTARLQAYAGATPLTAMYRTTNSVSSLTVTAPADKKVRPGSVVTYRASVTIPKGTSVYDIQWSQTLPKGFQYIEGTSAGPGGPFTDWNPVISGNASSGETITWSTASDTSHDVVTDNINDVVLTITFNARVMDDAINIPGGTPAKTSNFSYGYKTVDGTGSVVTAPVASDTVTVSEPALTITKSLISAPSGYKAGDTIKYQLIIRNSSNETAYDAAIISQLAADVTYASDTLNRNPSNAAPVSFHQIGSRLGWGVDGSMNADGSLDIPAGETLTLEINATVNSTVIPLETLQNTGIVAWSSMDGIGISQERTYGPLNDGTADFTVADPTAITKSIESAPAPTYVIGDIIDYRLDVIVLQGTTHNMVVHDTLPAGVELVSVGLITGTAGVSFTTPSNPVTGSTGPISWNFGTVTSSADSGGSFTLRYQARIQNIDDNDAGDSLASASVANVTYDAAAGNIQKNAAALPGFTVREPRLVMTKSYAAGTYQAGDTVQVTLKVKHNSTANPYNVTAHDLEVKDLIPDGMIFVSADNGGTASGDTITWNNVNMASLLNGNELTLSYVLKIGDTAKPRQTMGTTATVTWTSLPGVAAGERSGAGGIDNYSATAADSFQTADHSVILKELISTGPYPVGAAARYRLSFSVNEGTINGVKVTDDLPTGLKLGAVTVDLGANFTTTQNIQPVTGAMGTVTWDFGDITNQVNGITADDTIVIEYTAIVWDSSATENGDTLTNTAHLLYSDGTGPNQKDSSGVGITVVEPKLAVSLAKTPNGPFQVNETVTYTVTVSHTGDSTADAYDLQITDILPAGLNYSSTAPNPDNPGVPQQTGQTIAWGGGINLPLGQTYKFQITAFLDSSVEPDQSMDNAVSVQWSSLPAANNDRRVYSAVNSNTVNITSVDNTGIAKSIVGMPAFVIGENFDYQLVVSVNKGTTEAVTVHDTLPDGVALVSVGSVAGTPGVSFTMPANPTTGSTGPVSWNFGIVTSSADNGSITILYKAQIQNSTANNAGDEKLTPPGAAKVTYQNAAGSVLSKEANLVTFIVKEPRLVVSKSYNVGTWQAGSAMEVTVMVWHYNPVDSHHATAYNLQVTDMIPAKMLNPSSISDGGTAGAAKVTWNIAQLDTNVDAAHPLTLTYQVTLGDDIQPGEQLSGTVNIQWESLPSGSQRRTGIDGPGGTLNDYAAIGSATTNAVDSTDFIHSVIGGVEPAVGAAIPFRIQININEGTTLDVEAKATLPAGLKFDHAAISKGNNGIAYTGPTGPVAEATGSIAWNFGTVLNPSNNISADDTITIDYWVTVTDIPGSVQGHPLTIPAHLEYTDGSGSLVVKPDQNAGIALVEPELAITKTGPAAVNLATNANFTIAVQNNGLGTAWQTVVTDTLPAEMSNQTPVITAISVGGRALTAPGDYEAQYSADTGAWTISLKSNPARIAPGEALTVSYQSVLNNEVFTAKDITNTAAVTRYYSLDSGGGVGPETRTYPAGPVMDDLSFTLLTPVMVTLGEVDKATASPGEVLHYKVILTNNGNSNVANATLTTAAGVDFRSGTIANVTADSGSYTVNPSGGPNGTGGIVFSGVSIPKDGGQAIFEWDITLKPALGHGTQAGQTAQLEVPGFPAPIAGNIPKTLIHSAPALSVMKRAADLNGGSLVPGDIIKYTLTIGNTGNENVKNAVLTDSIPAHTTYVAASTLLNGTAVADSGDASPLVAGLTVNTPGEATGWVNAGETATVEFEVRIDADVAPGTVIPNQATWTGAGEGSGTMTPVVSDDPDTADPMDPTRITMPDLTAFSHTLTGGVEPTVGAKVPFRIRANASEGATPDFIVKATLPAGLKFDHAVVSKGNTGITYTGPAGPAGEATGSIAWSFGIVFNPSNGNAMDDTITIDYWVTVADIPENVQDHPLIIPAHLEYTDGSGSPVVKADQTAQIQLVEPELAIGKTGPDAVTLGTNADFTVTVQNNGLGTAWQTVISDTLPAEMKVQAPVITAINTGGRALTAPADYEVQYSADTGVWTISLKSELARIAPGEALLVNYQSILNNEVFPVKTISNTAEVSRYYSLDSGGGVGPETRTYPAGPVTATASFELLTPVIVTLGEVDQTTASPGEVLRYKVTLTNNGNTDVIDATLTTAAGVDFSSGTIANVTAGSGSYVIDPAGGANATGGIVFSGVSLPKTGGQAVFEWDITLKPALAHGREAEQTAQLEVPGFPAPIAVNIPKTLIQSAPVLTAAKRAIDLNGGSLAPGDVIHYTITIGNTGNENAKDVFLTDSIPANTTYVANTTKLNGAVVADSNSASPLNSGLAVSTPGAATGWVNAGETATVEFQVAVGANVVAGTVITNQATLNGDGEGSGSAAPVLSDDPDTETQGDATRCVVGNVPLLYAVKTVTDDNGGTLDPGDIITYTVIIYNQGTAEATGLIYRDRIPELTTYVPGSVTIDGVSAPDAIQTDGSFTYSLGSLAPGAKKVLTFKVQVDPGSDGRIISSQGTVGSVELPDCLTDADVNPANGSQPTEIPVGSAPALRVTKQVSDLNGGLAVAGDTLVYTITLTNAGNAAATNVRLFDDVPAELTYIAGSTRVNGVLEADSPGLVLTNGLNLGTLAPQARVIVEFRAGIRPGVAVGTVIDNQARFEADANLSGVSDSDLDDGQELGNNQFNANDDDPTRIQVGGSPGAAAISGTVWWDKNGNGQDDPSEAKAAGWKVELLQNDLLIATGYTDGDGKYEFNGINPGDRYRVRFRHPDTDVAWRELDRLTLLSGMIATDQDLPIQPTGIVFDAVTRQPVAGVTVTITGPAGFDPSLHLLPGELGQQTQADGMYRLELSTERGAPAGTYQIAIAPPQTYSPSFPSTMLPPQPGSYHPGQSGSPVVTSSDPPAQGEAGRYYLSFVLDAAGSQMVNNHIPVDPILEGSILLTKTAAKRSATVGDIILYTVKLENQISALIQPFSLQDRIPAGFKYVKGSARVGGAPIEPEGAAILSWKDLTLQPNAALTVTYYLVVGTGVAEGNIYKNSATAYHGITGTAISNTGVAQVQIVADPVFSDSIVIGKVFYDGNANGVQDEGEDGIAGARLITAGGQIITTDAFGRYHVPEIAVKYFSRGQNYVIKVDPASLMKGLEFTTENPRVIRLTQGTMAKVNFGVRMVPAELSYTPDWGINNGPVEMVLTGNRLHGGVGVTLVREGLPEIPGEAVRPVAAGKVAVTFDLTGRLAGPWDLVISDQKAFVASERTTAIRAGFTVVNQAPTVIAIEPNHGFNDEVLAVAAIRGTGFRPGATVLFERDGKSIAGIDVTVISDTRIACRVDLRQVPAGAYDLRVVNDDGQSGKLEGALTVAEPVRPPVAAKPAEPVLGVVPLPEPIASPVPEVKTGEQPTASPAPPVSTTAPRIELVSPDRAFADGSVLITLTGANFAPGAMVKVEGNGVAMTGANVTVKGKTSISCFLHLNEQPLGRYDITVTNPDGQSATLVKEFQVLPALEKRTLLKPVYFDLNKAVIRPDQLPVVQADLAVLKQNPKLQIILGGHCDERGSYEYNLGLSERRCRSIQAYLIRQGIAAERITIYSYGKKEASRGQSENTWQKDRRVDIIGYERLD